MLGAINGAEYRLDFKETELRLGLPGANANEADTLKNNGKRGFLETVDLKLNLASKGSSAGLSTESEMLKDKNSSVSSSTDPANPPAKAQVVGWPPVRSFRKNTMAVQKNSGKEAAACDDKRSSSNSAAFVKVSVDGAPYLRKVDLKAFKSYQELSEALSKMFISSSTLGNYGSHQEFKDFMNESKLIDLLNGSEYVPTYEDKDGDWMLVGDVPWEMFVDSCKRLRMMKGSEAIGLAPRAVEKCKKRS